MRGAPLLLLLVAALALAASDVARAQCSTGQYVSSGGQQTGGGYSVRCEITIDNTLGPVVYDGVSLSVSGQMNSWPQSKTFSFTSRSGATLVLQGFDWEAGNSGHCRSAGLAFRCFSSDPVWNGFSSADKSQITGQEAFVTVEKNTATHFTPPFRKEHLIGVTPGSRLTVTYENLLK